MPTQDPNNKNTVVNGATGNSYDDTTKVTNGDNPVREGQENSSILSDNEVVQEESNLFNNVSNDDPQVSQTNDWNRNPEQQEEWIDTDKVNFKPED